MIGFTLYEQSRPLITGSQRVNAAAGSPRRPCGSEILVSVVKVCVSARCGPLSKSCLDDSYDRSAPDQVINALRGSRCGVYEGSARRLMS